jgi:hydrogenase maturation protein HypF
MGVANQANELKMIESKIAAQINVRGVVQGVGFRPFVYQLAAKYELSGWVYNTSEDVTIWIEGKPKSIQSFLKGLTRKPPSQAIIEHILTKYDNPTGCIGFTIRSSVINEGKYQLVSPDIATCADCQSEIINPGNRRYHYPFTNCTNCGPRFTIIEDIPYDRPRTTMSHFRMCPECLKEYDDPHDRRFHAEPNACPSCGPRLELFDNKVNKLNTDDPIITAASLLKQGKIIALKGLGGFLVACDATNTEAVELLRKRKNRPMKPLAVMVEIIEQLKQYCLVNKEEVNLLRSPQSPIVLLRRRVHSTISPSVAPGLSHLGVMLPYTPLHHLLLRETALPLVMTSGNLSEDPIAKDNDEAFEKLSGIADYFLVHDRLIHSTYDDSVTMIEQGRIQLIRRARGYAPFPVKLSYQGPHVLACGAQEKNTFCLTAGEYAFVSQHIGDLDGPKNLRHYEKTIELYKNIFQVHPKIIAGDMHPDYLSTRYAIELATRLGLNFVPVQHHHAHVVSSMADAGVTTPVIGVAFDGTGLGTDGHIWGGEFLVADYYSFRRMAHLQYLPLPGGDIAIKKPYRTAVGYLVTLLGDDILNADLPFLEHVDQNELNIVLQQVSRHLNSPITSSCGRLFDAVSALIGVRDIIRYDAQAAIELEVLASRYPSETGEYPFCWRDHEGVHVIGLDMMFQSIIKEIHNRTPVPVIATRFHNTIARMISSLCLTISEETGITHVALSGGVFQNRLLQRRAMKLLKADGLSVILHRQVPCNDGGISLGQAVIGGTLSAI